MTYVMFRMVVGLIFCTGLAFAFGLLHAFQLLRRIRPLSLYPSFFSESGRYLALLWDWFKSYLVVANDGLEGSDVSGGSGESFRAPQEQISVIFRQFIVGRVVEGSSWAIVCAEVAEATSCIPILWETHLRVLRIFLLFLNRNHADAFFRAYPSTDSAARTFVHVKQMSTAKTFRKQDLLVRIL